MLIRASAVLPSVVGEHGFDAYAVLFEERQHVVVEHMDRGQRQLARVAAIRGVAAIAVEHPLQIDVADTLRHIDEKCVDRDELSRVRHLDLAFTELRTWSATGVRSTLRRRTSPDLAVAAIGTAGGRMWPEKS